MPLVKIKNIVRNLEGDIPFLQPMYEAIVNALEAKATDISIALREEKNTLLDDDKNYEKKIIGFDITDNGDGFTPENRKSFCEYLVLLANSIKALKF
jgi:nitrogen fixation/metabolism regulation signal transduction histidine kinase